MDTTDTRNSLLRQIPGVDRILELARRDEFFEHIPRSLLRDAARQAAAHLRQRILQDDRSFSRERLADAAVLDTVRQQVARLLAPNLRPVINATGVVVHTNLGRSPLAEAAVENVVALARQYSNLEYDLDRGVRGSRYSNVEPLVCELTGAEAAMVVNNNAGAVLLCLDTVAKGRGVLVSRGELVEIGGSFRIPDVMAKSGAVLKEVGATNRTHLRDYENAIDEETGMLLKVHTSNYRIVGFTAAVTLRELVELGAAHRVPVMEDLGSGTLIDFSRYGLVKEPTIQESVAAGADLVTFSGDKLLGGPQAGVIAGKKEMIDRIKSNPLTRALRIDKLTLAAFESTLRLYRDEADAVARIPTLKMITMPMPRIEEKAVMLAGALGGLGGGRVDVQRVKRASKTGGGSLPLLDIPTVCVRVTVRDFPVHSLEAALRRQTPPVIGRIEDEALLLDVRTVKEDEIPMIVNAFSKLIGGDVS